MNDIGVLHMDFDSLENRSYVPDQAVSDFRRVVTTIADLNDIYDMSTLVNRLHICLGELCSALKVKKMECEILPAGGTGIESEAINSFVLYETEGAEFENISYECPTPAGEIIRCSLSLLHMYPEDMQILKCKGLCEQVCLYVSRARIGTSLSDVLNRDTDTGLPNMQTFLAFGERLFAEFRIADYCVVALNISNFKFVNQTVPFEVGTNVIVKYAHRLFSLIESDEIVTRFGGDNFNILLKKDNLERFLEQVKKIPIDIKDGNMRVHFELSSYAGIYIFETRMAIQAALENASNARAIAKVSPHRPFVFYTEDMGEKQHHKNQVRARFAKALENHEFIAYYQPKVNVVTQDIIGMEALVRWDSSEGLLWPTNFISILEDTSAVIELDRCILYQVCRDIKRWESMEIEVPRISVNLSRRNLTTEGIADEIAAILDEYHIDHNKVEIEVTETVDNAEFNFLGAFIRKMKSHGIKVSIDDFGTGYSSLNLLKNLNADVLKIDRSFIDIDKFGDKDELLMKSIINLAKSYDMEVIAEGVETEEQLRFLYKCGCENIQGFFFDMPVSKQEVTDRLKLGKYDKKYTLE